MINTRKIKVYNMILILTTILVMCIIVGNARVTESPAKELDIDKLTIGNELYTIEQATKQKMMQQANTLAKINTTINYQLKQRSIEIKRKLFYRNAVENDRIMFIGNSLVEGLRLNNDSNNQFYCKVGVSLSGLRSKIYGQIDNASFDIAVIEMGTNELGGWSAEDFKSSYIDLIDRILSNNPSAKVICLSIPPVSQSRDNSGSRFNNKNVTLYNKHIESVAASFDQTIYLDCSPFFGDILKSNWTGDGIHLSSSVYREWYNYIIDKISNMTN